MGKTIKEWLSELPEPYRNKALENMQSPERKVPSLFAALNDFTWSDTKQGYDYWYLVYEYHWKIQLEDYERSKQNADKRQ